MLRLNFQYTEAYRQGEILIFKVTEIPKTYGDKKHVPTGIIRIGEKEGHEHKLTGGNFSFNFLDDEQETGTIEATGPVTLTHPEHKDIKLPKGKYVVGIQKEATGKHTHSSVKD